MEPEPIEIPITDVFDLHTIAPKDCQAAVEAYLEEARARGYTVVRIIHGKGIGVQREMVRKVLFRMEYVKDYRDAPLEAGGWGATVVEFGEKEKQEMGEEMAYLLAEFDANLANAGELTGGLTVAQFNWRSEPGRWSIGQCLDHLAITGNLYADGITRAMEDGRRKQWTGTGAYRPGWFERWLISLLEPPAKRKGKAPAVFVPAENLLDPVETTKRYMDANRRLKGLLQQSAGLDLRRIRVVSPVTRLLKLSLVGAFALTAAHDRRHLYQGWEVRKASGFPG